MRHLLGIQIALIALVSVVCANSAEAQEVRRGNYNFREFQSKPVYFGITLGYNTSTFQIKNSDRFILNDSFAIAEAKPGPGFNVSLVTNLKMGDYFDFRFLPGFSFAERSIRFQRVDNLGQDITSSIESVFIQMPFRYVTSQPLTRTKGYSRLPG